MNTIGKSLLLIGLVCLLATGCAGQRVSSNPIPKVIAFGDSLTDIGLAQKITFAETKGGSLGAVLPPVDTYWQGRCSNGPVAVEVLAQHLNAELADYAVAGAMSNEYNGGIRSGSRIYETGMLNQLKNYQADLDGKPADPDALYFIMISANDWEVLSKDLYSKMKPEVADVTIANIETVISALTEMGAKRFLVVNSMDATKAPDVILRKIVEEAQAFQDRFDEELPGKMSALAKKLDVEIVVFDLQATEDKIRSDPEKYGLTNLSEPCLSSMFSANVCSDPDTYYYWDPYHYTRKVHQIIGEAMAAVYGK